MTKSKYICNCYGYISWDKNNWRLKISMSYSRCFWTHFVTEHKRKFTMKYKFPEWCELYAGKVNSRVVGHSVNNWMSNRFGLNLDLCCVRLRVLVCFARGAVTNLVTAIRTSASEKTLFFPGIFSMTEKLTKELSSLSQSRFISLLAIVQCLVWRGF